MRIAKASILFFAALTLLIALPCLAAEEIAITGTEVECLTCVCPDCNPGTTKMLPNGGMQLRDLEGIYLSTATDPRLAGYARVTINWSVDAYFQGQMWGSFYSCDESGNRLPDGFEGTWNGEIFSIFPYNWINYNILHGYGAYEGLKAESTTAYGNTFTGTIVGILKDTNKE